MSDNQPTMVGESSINPHSPRYKDTIRVTLIGAVIDLILGVVKIVVGLLAQSQALIADGVHSLSDLVTDGIILYAAKHSHQEADEEHPYGHGRFETVATVGLGIALMAVSAGIAFDAIRRLFNPEELLVPGVGALIVAGFSILAKEAIYHYTMHFAHKHNSNMLRANAWHSRSDAISSVIVLIGVGGSMAGLWYLDAVAAIGVAYMVAKIGWDLSWHSIRELVDTSLEPERVDAIRDAILSVDGVESLHILRTRRMAGEALVDVHIQVLPTISVSEAHYISETVRSRVIKEIEEVADVMIHIDPEDDEVAPPTIDLPLRNAIMARLDENWKGISAADQIEEVTLHYLDGRIQVVVHLPLTVLKDNDADSLQAEFKNAVKSIRDVSAIQLSFR